MNGACGRNALDDMEFAPVNSHLLYSLKFFDNEIDKLSVKIDKMIRDDKQVIPVRNQND